ncbi:unnamed protein product, partial [Brenthis ino]
MSASGATTPTATEAPALDDRDMEPRTPMKRLGSTRKLAAFNINAEELDNVLTEIVLSQLNSSVGPDDAALAIILLHS